ncbi:insulinase family protein [Vibrio coralliilyticus]|uniref:M16 family metallopeptidase n=1 Tax=Vibrio coralliilyticus TaxID=190893 RepID=UPI00051296A9|nr:insulinase family protein [Vibrio coralliilyticus]AIS56906.1 peptidase M16 [Vibrio coralliilyticus]
MRILLFFIAVVISGCSSFPHDPPIEADKGWIEGTLDNGLKYHIYPVSGAPVSVRLFVRVGSAQETEQQRGYAHFLEHMAFNGSRHFSSNEMVSLFEQAGLTFGADINAYTAYYETVYQLDLPDNTQLNNALLWMRDIGDGLTIAPAEVEKEKGVIQGEIRRTRPENKSLADKYYDYLLKGTALEDLDPVGDSLSVQSATPESIIAFYKKWYHPENAELIVTGNIDTTTIEALIESQFASWKAGAGISKTRIDYVPIELSDFVDEVGEYEAPSITFMVQRGKTAITTQGDLMESWLDEVALHLINQRMERMYSDAAIPLHDLYISNYYINFNRYGILSASFPASERNDAQGIFLSTLASMRDYGVTQEEVDVSLAYYQQLLNDVDYHWRHKEALDFAESKVMSLSLQQPIQSREDYRQSLKRFLNLATLETVNEQLRDLLAAKYSVVIGVEPGDSIAAWQAKIPEIRTQYAKPGTQPMILSVAENELAEPSQNGAILSQEKNALGFEVWTLSNGIEVWFQQDSDAGDWVNVVYGSQGGKAALDPSLYPAVELTIPVISRSGLGDFNGPQLDTFLQRNSIEVYPYISFSHHGVEVGVPKNKLHQGFKVLFNFASDVNVESRHLKTVKQEYQQELKTYLSTPLGQWNQAINHNSYLPSSRHYMSSASGYQSVSEAQIRSVHEQLFGQFRGNKVVIIADLEANELNEVLRQYLASINLETAEPMDFEVGYNQNVESVIDLDIYNEQNSFYLIRLTNPSASQSSVRNAYIDDMIQRILSKRLTAYIREELGLDYAPEAYSAQQDQEPVTDWFVEAQVAPQDIDRIEQAIGKVLNDLLTDVKQSDVDAAARQLAVALQALENQPVDRTWFYARYLVHGYGVESLLDVDSMTSTITLDDVQKRIGESFGHKVIRSKYTLTPKPLER